MQATRVIRKEGISKQDLMCFAKHSANHCTTIKRFAGQSYELEPLNLTIRAGCDLAYETTVPTPVLFVLKPRLEGSVLVMREKLSFGIGLPSGAFQDSHGNITCCSQFLPGRKGESAGSYRG